MSINNNDSNFIIYFFVLLISLSCRQEIKTMVIKNRFSISYPSSYELDESGKEGTIFILRPRKKNKNNILIENINLVSNDIGNITFNEFTKQAKKDISNLAKITESKIMRINNEDCLRLVFGFLQKNIKLTFIQHYYVKNNKGYVLTFVSEAKEFKKNFNKMNNVLLSFKFNNNNVDVFKKYRG